MEGAQLTLSASMGLGFFLAVGIVYAVQGVKWLMEILPTTKTNNLPSWVWVASALIISALVCWFMKVDALASFGVDVGIYPPWSYLATALAIAVSSNVIAAVTKPLRKKLRTPEGKVVCLPPGEDVPELVQVPVDVSPQIPEETTGKPEQTSTQLIITPDVIPDTAASDNNESASGLSDQSAKVSPSDLEHVSGDNSQTGNVATQSGNGQANSAPSEARIEPAIDAVQPVQYVLSDPTYPAYLMRFVDVNTPLVVLSPEGKLYRVHNGKVTDLPQGWNTP